MKYKKDLPKDLSGLRFGRLEVLNSYTAINKNGKNDHYWLCKCDCGTIKGIRRNSLLNGCISCGCYRSEYIKNKNKQRRHLPGEKPRKDLFDAYKRQAFSRNLNFDISEEEFNKLTKENCYYCNSTPSNIRKNNKFIEDKQDVYIYNGIDRIDNNIGYKLSNCVSCCKKCNYGKLNMNKNEFLEWIKNVYNHSIVSLTSKF